jgi:aerobic carbon-monoxide dehydrogenase large subunit
VSDTVKETQNIGKRVQRLEDPRLLSGRAKYIDDICRPGMLHLSLVRAQVAHGRITEIDIDDAKDIGGDVQIFTGDDTIGLAVTANAEVPEMQFSQQPLLAENKVRFVGEAVAAVLAEDPYRAEDAAELVFVDYDILPVIADVRTALDEESPTMFDDWRDNLFVERQMQGGDLDAARKAAAHVVRRTYRTHRQAGVPLECRGVVAEYDPLDETLTVWSSTQIPHLLRTYLSEELGWPETRLRVVAPEVGGGFGVKGQIFTEEILVAWLALHTGRPVKWIEDRREHLIASIHARDHEHTLEAYLDDEGRLLGLQADITVDCGAYSTWPFTAASDPGMVAKVLPGPYDFGAYEATFRGVATNKCPVGTYRGVGRPSAVFSQERLMDDIAFELGIDPFELRLKNVIRSFPYKNVLGFVYDEGSYAASLERSRELLAPDIGEARKTKENSDIRVGVGFACFIEQTAHGTPDFTRRKVPIETGYEAARVEMMPDGSVLVETGMQSHGQGHETTFAQVAADALGVAPDDVRVRHGDTLTTPYSVGTWGSRGISLGGGAVHLAASEIAKKLRAIAAHLLDVNESQIVLGCRRAAVAGDSERFVEIGVLARSALRDLEQVPDGMAPGLEAYASCDGPAHGSYSNAVHSAVVKIDMKSGKLTLRRFVVVEDCGRIINPMIVDGQVRGGVVQGIGSAMFEHFVYNEDCQPLTTNFADYLMPASPEIPDIEVHHFETPTSLTPLGAKGLGEGGAIGPAAAIANAVSNALGIGVCETPLNANAIWDLIQTLTPPNQT